jgi:hypothetical protein
MTSDVMLKAPSRPARASFYGARGPLSQRAGQMPEGSIMPL